MIVVRREDAKQFSPAPGVQNKILITGDEQMLVLLEIAQNAEIPLHSHMNEQVGVCLRGEIEFRTEQGPVIVDENTAYVFKSNEKHGCRALSKEGVVLLESFSPPRDDFLARAK